METAEDNLPFLVWPLNVKWTNEVKKNSSHNCNYRINYFLEFIANNKKAMDRTKDHLNPYYKRNLIAIQNLALN